MTNLFKVRLNRESEDFEKRFELAFDDIYALAEKLSTSENVIIKKYIECFDEPWLFLEEDCVQFITEGFVTIGKNDALGANQLEYDFGKRAPADDAFLMAIMSIFYHHVPGTEFYSEVEVYDESFDDGVLLARLVNDKIENPFIGQHVPLVALDVHRSIRNVYRALMDISIPKKEVRFYSR